MRTKTILIICLFFTTHISKAQNFGNDNLFDYAKGARVVDFSSNFEGQWDVQCVLQNSPVNHYGDWPAWATEKNAPFPHFVTIEFKNPEWLNIIDFNNVIPDESEGWPGISAKDIEVYISNTSKDEGFSNVINFRLENNKGHQIVKIIPTQAKWVKFVITSNYGHAEYTELGQLGVFDDKQRNLDIKTEMEKNGYINMYGLYFDFGSDKLKIESAPAIEQLVKYLKENPNVKIQVEGHTDNIGTSTANLTLSEKRASTVKNDIVKNGIGTERLNIKGFGSLQPISNNSTDIGRAQNRRVTIRKI
jgi:outer membrane protein OmpA-like peptidoglycan-associated protein